MGNHWQKLLSINVAQPRAMSFHGRTVMTGIFKEPVAGRVHVGKLGLEGDDQADPENHGGVYKAVYSYPMEHYEYWSRVLTRNDLAFGAFGENLTVSGYLEDQVNIGDTFRAGTALLEVTQPRVPCFKLATKLNLPQFPRQFTMSGRTGFYHRVLEEGEVSAGDSFERVSVDPRGVTVREMMRLMHIDREDFPAMEKAADLPALTPGWRDELKERLRTRGLN